MKFPENQDEEMISMIHSSGCTAVRLSKDLLDSYKLDLGTFTITREVVDIVPFLNKYNILSDIEIEYDGDVFIDPVRINQVINNLLSNAKDFVDKDDGKIVVKCEKKDQNILFSVTDNGVGIPKSKRNKLFIKFSENVNPKIKRTHPRTGIGLSISKNIIEMHGGKMWLDTNYVDGARFCFTIPV
jgi:signal transduction histidine kinase